MLHRTVMGDIAFPAAGDQELDTGASIALQEHNAGTAFGSPRCGHESGATGTDDNDGFHLGS